MKKKKRAYDMLQLCLQAMLCTVCLHAHDIMQDPFHSFLGISQTVYQFYRRLSAVCASHQVLFCFLIVVFLHNSVLYASDATLNERNETLSCAPPSLLQNWTQLWRASGIEEQLPFLCVWYRLSLSLSSSLSSFFFTIQPSDNSAMFIHVETWCFPPLLREEYAKACTVQ